MDSTVFDAATCRAMTTRPLELSQAASRGYRFGLPGLNLPLRKKDGHDRTATANALSIAKQFLRLLRPAMDDRLNTPEISRPERGISYAFI